jgi:GUN4-like
MSIDDVDSSDMSGIETIPECIDNSSIEALSIEDRDTARMKNEFSTAATAVPNHHNNRLTFDRFIAIATLVLTLISLINGLFPLQTKSILGNLPFQEKFDPKLISGSIDYNRLNNLLADKRYKEANEETSKIVVENILGKTSDRENISTSDIEGRLKRKDIQIVDELWNKHSSNYYGFNIQSCLWRKINKQNPSSPNENVISLFQEIKWIDNNLRVNISEMNFDDAKSDKPMIKGYLPRLSWNTESNKPLVTILNDYTNSEDSKYCKN